MLTRSTDSSAEESVGAAATPVFLRMLRTRGALIGVALAGFIAHFGFAHPIYSLWDRGCAWLVFLLTVITARKFLLRGAKYVPLKEITFAQIYIFFCLPQFRQSGLILFTGYYTPSSRALSMATTLVLVGAVVWHLGYALACKLFENKKPFFDELYPRPNQKWLRAIILYAIPALVVHALLLLRPEFVPISVRFMITQVFNIYLAQILLLYLGYAKDLRIARKYAYVLMTCMMALGFVQGVMGNIAFPLIVLFLAAWIWGRAVRLRWILLVVIAVIIINPVKSEFRSLAWGDKDISSWSKVERRLSDWNLAFNRVWTGGVRSEDNVATTADRMSELLPVAMTIDLVPGKLPYLHGDGFGKALFFWVPRFLWPSKPSSTDLLFNKYAVAFGFTSTEGTESTTVGASIFVEGYWNFGSAGIVGGMLISGLLLGGVFGRNSELHPVTMMCAMVYLASTMLLINPVTLAIPSMVTFLIGLYIALTLLAVVSSFLRGR